MGKYVFMILLLLKSFAVFAYEFLILSKIKHIRIEKTSLIKTKIARFYNAMSTFFAGY